MRDEPRPFTNNGDIICLLPLLKTMADARGKPVTMLVAKEMLPLLSGVSYVEPVIGGQDAGMTGCVTANLYRRGLVPTTEPVGFAELAWHRLGYKWDAKLPLVFDQRDKRREGRLARSVLRTDLPALLLKLEGKSSPLPDPAKLRVRLIETFRKDAEIVLLDLVKAERIYDLLGLMDRASCMVTVDTSTLWLAHASKVPTIALVHPLDARASPVRGNTILRLRYTEVESMWPHMERMIRAQLS